MERRFTFEIIMHDDGNVNITTINDGNFNLMEKYGIIELCKTAITSEHNRNAGELGKNTRKQIKHQHP